MEYYPAMKTNTASMTTCMTATNIMWTKEAKPRDAVCCHLYEVHSGKTKQAARSQNGGEAAGGGSCWEGFGGASGELISSFC